MTLKEKLAYQAEVIEQRNAMLSRLTAKAQAMIQASAPYTKSDIALAKAWRDLRKAVPIQLIGSDKVTGGQERTP